MSTTSPGRIVRMRSPRDCTRPSPPLTDRGWPIERECPEVRAPGAKCTAPSDSGAGPCPEAIGSIQTSPVNQFSGPRAVALLGWTSMRTSYLLRWSRAQQRLDDAALVHRPVALGGLLERQLEVEHRARVDLAVADELDQLGQEPSHRRGAAVQVDPEKNSSSPGRALPCATPTKPT